jgi:hypothetical protein
MPRGRRLQASDIFNRSTPLFERRIPFAEAYPAMA